MPRLGVHLTEDTQVILWPPENKAEGKTRVPVKATFPIEMDAGDGPRKHLARLNELREREAAEARKDKTKPPTVDDILGEAESKLDKKPKDPLDVGTQSKIDARDLNVDKDIYKVSELRNQLGKLVTDPRNRAFSRNLVNRVWAELLGRGFVNPVDDFRGDNAPSHPETLDYLADEFVASGYDFRALVRSIVSSEAYQRAHLPVTVDAVVRQESQQAFTAATVRRMNSEALFDSVVQAGHLFNVKHNPGENKVTVRSDRSGVHPREGRPHHA